MKFVFNRSIAAICLLCLLLSGCSADSSFLSADNLSGGEIKVLAPAPTSGGQYKLQVFELLGIEDLKTLTGRFARFFFSPRVVNSQLEGVNPTTRFVLNSNNEYIPANSMTQQMVAVYFHMQNMAALDKEFGVEGLNVWPRSVGLAVNVKGNVVNNAFYDGKSDAMLIVPYEKPDLAIALNGGILAHEHFHSLFYKLVLKGDMKSQAHSRDEFFKHGGISDEDVSEDKNMQPRFLPSPEEATLTPSKLHYYYHQTMKRALNEGLADFWGWMYTGDVNFIEKSLKTVGVVRSLEVSQKGFIPTLPRVIDLQYFLNSSFGRVEASQFDGNTMAYAYQVGTAFARFFKEFTDTYASARDLNAITARHEVAKKIVQTLPSIQIRLQALTENTYYSSADLLVDFVKEIPDLKKQECALLANTINDVQQDSDNNYVCSTADQNTYEMNWTPRSKSQPDQKKTDTPSTDLKIGPQ